MDPLPQPLAPQEISLLVEKVREIEAGYSRCRSLPDRRNAIKPFTQWLADLGATIDGVEVGGRSSRRSM